MGSGREVEIFIEMFLFPFRIQSISNATVKQNFCEDEYLKTWKHAGNISKRVDTPTIADIADYDLSRRGKCLFGNWHLFISFL